MNKNEPTVILDDQPVSMNAAPEGVVLNKLIESKDEIPTSLLTDEEVKAFFDLHKATRDHVPLIVTKAQKAIYNSWLWNSLGRVQQNSKRLAALKVKQHDAETAPIPTGALKQAVKARGKAKQVQDEAVHGAMYEAILAELAAKGVDLSVLDG